MNGINSNSLRVPEFKNLEDKELQTMQQTALSVRERQDMDLEIVTSEGDVVTLSSEKQSNMDYMSYDQKGASKGKSVEMHNKALSIEVSSGFSISVKGDLNEDELKEIQMLIKEVDSVMSSMVSGEMDDAVAKAMKIGGFDTISTFEAELSIQKSTMFQQRSASKMENYASRDSIMDSTTDKPKQLLGADASLKSLLDTMMERIEEAKLEAEKLMNPLMDSIDQLFKHYIADFSDDEDVANEKIVSLETMQQGILERVGQLIEKNESFVETVV